MYVLSARRRTCRQDLRFARACLKKNFCGIKYNIIGRITDKDGNAIKDGINIVMVDLGK